MELNRDWKGEPTVAETFRKPSLGKFPRKSKVIKSSEVIRSALKKKRERALSLPIFSPH